MLSSCPSMLQLGTFPGIYVVDRDVWCQSLGRLEEAMDLEWLDEGVGGETLGKHRGAKSLSRDIDAQAMLEHGLPSRQ